MKHRIPALVGMMLGVIASARGAFAADPTLISVKHGTHTFVGGESFGPSLSADGRTIAFESRARLTADDKNRVRDIYVLNTRTNEMRRIPPPTKVKLNSGPFVSRDGSAIALHVYSSSVFPSKLPRTADIYLYEMASQVLKPLFESSRAELKGGEALYPVMSRDTRTVLFTSNSDLDVRHVYVVDRDRGSLTLVSRSNTGVAGNRPSGLARLSADGSVAVFVSASTNFDAAIPVTSLSTHLYLADLVERRVVRLDTFDRGFDDRKWVLGSFDINDGADLVVFEGRHRSTNPYETLASSDLFLYDAQKQKSTLLTEGLFSDASRSPSISGNGQFVAFVLVGKKQNRLVVLNRDSNSWNEAAVGNVDNPVLSKNGCVLAFERVDKKVRNIYTAPNPFMENNDACH